MTSNRPRIPAGGFARLALGAMLAMLSGAAAAMDPREAELFEALDRFDAGDRAGGYEALYQVTARYRDFLAAHVIEASLLRTEDLGATLLEITPRPNTKPGPLKELRDEAHARLAYWFDRPPQGRLPDVLIEAAPDRTTVAVADTARARLHLFDRSEGGWVRRGDWYASIGKGGIGKRRRGDGRTPLGVYFVTMRLPDEHLPELYGAGALGLNYPNGWDRHRGRTGYGIWIHGEPRGLSIRPPRWSLGCLTVSNPALDTLVRAIGEASVPVIIGERLRWLAPDEHERRRNEWLTRIGDLNGGGITDHGFGIYGYPVGAGEEAAMVLVEFRAERAGGGRWWQYWRENGDGGWRIAHEGPASFLDVHHKGLPPRMPAEALRRFTP